MPYSNLEIDTDSKEKESCCEKYCDCDCICGICALIYFIIIISIVILCIVFAIFFWLCVIDYTSIKRNNHTILNVADDCTNVISGIIERLNNLSEI